MIDINAILDRASKLKIAVIGDFIEDRYIIGKVNRISPEAPVPVLDYQDTEITMGGAANVYKNLKNLGVKVDLYCNFNEDRLFWDTEREEIFTNNSHHSIKTRYVADSHQLLRLDVEVGRDQIEWQPFKAFSWWEHLQEHFGEYDRIVISDYHKGCVSDSLINAVMELALHYKIPVVVDAKKDFSRYHMATIMKCNKKEAEDGNLFRYPNVAEWRVVTCGEAGMSLYDQSGNGEGIKGLTVNIVDVCGCGDTVTAVLAMMYSSDESMLDACELANIAASEVCQHSGVWPIVKEDLIRRFNEVQV